MYSDPASTFARRLHVALDQRYSCTMTEKNTHVAFQLTRLAKAVAEAKYSLDAVRDRAAHEIDKEGIDIDKVFLHCFGMTAEDEQLNADNIEFVIVSQDDGVYIDTVSFQTEVMDAGPFKGKIVCYPVPDTFGE